MPIRLVVKWPALPDIVDKRILEAGIREALKEAIKTKSRVVLVDVLAQALSLAPRVSGAFTAELVREAPVALKDIRDTDDAMTREGQARLLERSLSLAADGGNKEIVKQLVDCSLRWLKVAKAEPKALGASSLVVGRSLRSLRRVKLREKEKQVLERLTEVYTAGKPVADLRVKYGKAWPDRASRLFTSGGGRTVAGPAGECQTVSRRARQILFSTPEVGGSDSLHPVAYARLAAAYATAVAQAPTDEAVKRIEELFKRIAKLNSTFTTNGHFSILHTAVIEAAVLGLDPDGEVDSIRP